MLNYFFFVFLHLLKKTLGARTGNRTDVLFDFLGRPHSRKRAGNIRITENEAEREFISGFRGNAADFIGKIGRSGKPSAAETSIGAHQSAFAAGTSCTSSGGRFAPGELRSNLTFRAPLPIGRWSTSFSTVSVRAAPPPAAQQPPGGEAERQGEEQDEDDDAVFHLLREKAIKGKR